MHGGKSDAIRSLEMLLDYAIISGAELKLPVFVFLLRIAQMELLNSLEQGSSPDKSEATMTIDELQNGHMEMR